MNDFNKRFQQRKNEITKKREELLKEHQEYKRKLKQEDDFVQTILNKLKIE